jgi:hypothetical protein
MKAFCVEGRYSTLVQQPGGDAGLLPYRDVMRDFRQLVERDFNGVSDDS